MNDQNNKYHAPETLHEISLATLNDEFATIFSTELLIKLLNLINGAILQDSGIALFLISLKVQVH
jgi:hypothetical protein